MAAAEDSEGVIFFAVACAEWSCTSSFLAEYFGRSSCFCYRVSGSGFDSGSGGVGLHPILPRLLHFLPSAYRSGFRSHVHLGLLWYSFRICLATSRGCSLGNYLMCFSQAVSVRGSHYICDLCPMGQIYVILVSFFGFVCFSIFFFFGWLQKMKDEELAANKMQLFSPAWLIKNQPKALQSWSSFVRSGTADSQIRVFWSSPTKLCFFSGVSCTAWEISCPSFSFLLGFHLLGSFFFYYYLFVLICFRLLQITGCVGGTKWQGGAVSIGRSVLEDKWKIVGGWMARNALDLMGKANKCS